jgi:hypothetical protein
VSDNPYEAPNADVSESVDVVRAEDIKGLIVGQKMVIFAILLNLAANGVAFAAPKLMIVVALAGVAALILAIVGTVRLASNLGFHPVVTVLVCLLMLVPCISLLVLLSLNSRATARIKEAGFEVGLLGAKT